MKKIYILALVLLLICSVAWISFNFTQNSWFLHPDDSGEYTISKNLFEEGSFCLEMEKNSLNSTNKELFIPQGIRLSGNCLVPSKSLGDYPFYSFFFLYGELGPFIAIGLFSIILLLFVFLYFKQIENIKLSLVVLFFTTFSFSIIYWSKMLFPNIIAASLFFVGIFLIEKNKSLKKPELNMLSFFFLSLSIIVRYEYLLIILPFVFLTFKGNILSKTQFSLKFCLFLCIAATPFIILNYFVYGGIFSTGYNYMPDSANNPIVVGTIEKYGLHIFRPDIPLIISNFKNFIIKIMATMFGMFIIALFFITKNKRKKELILLLITLPLFYYIIAAEFWGNTTGWVGGSYTRYLIPMYIFWFYLGVKYLKEGLIINKRMNILIFFMIIITFLLINCNLLTGEKFGLTDTMQEKQTYKQFDNFAKQTDENSIIITNLISKGIISRDVFDIGKAKELNISYDSIKIDISMLLQTRKEVYLVEIENHQKTFYNLKELINKDEDYILLSTNYTSPIYENKIYRIILK